MLVQAQKKNLKLVDTDSHLKEVYIIFGRFESTLIECFLSGH